MKSKKAAAFVLLDVLISIFLLSLLSLVFTKLIMSQAKIVKINKIKMEMNYLAQSVIEEKYSRVTSSYLNMDYGKDYKITFTESKDKNTSRMEVKVYSEEIEKEVVYVLYK